MIEAELERLTFAYRPGTRGILHNGHTVQVNYERGSSLTVSGRSFELTQFHLHSPSENRIEGESFPLEAHLVHVDAGGNLAVVAVMFGREC
jgi:carbonic anhydrase